MDLLEIAGELTKAAIEKDLIYVKIPSEDSIGDAEEAGKNAAAFLGIVYTKLVELKRTPPDKLDVTIR